MFIFLEKHQHNFRLFSKNNEQYQVFKTDEKKYMSFKEVSHTSIDINEFTTDLKPNRDKILLINDDFTFDNFTKKYGQLTKDLQYIYIQWDRVARDFKGFY